MAFYVVQYHDARDGNGSGDGSLGSSHEDGSGDREGPQHIYLGGGELEIIPALSLFPFIISSSDIIVDIFRLEALCMCGGAYD